MHQNEHKEEHPLPIKDDRLLQAIRLTWIIFVVVAALHLWAQNRMTTGLIASLVEIVDLNHSKHVAAEGKVFKQEILADLQEVKDQLKVIRKELTAPSPTVAAAPTQAGAAVKTSKTGRARGGRRGKR